MHRRLGPLLCWAIVYADIGTSIYYVPGILSRDVGASAASFVLATGFAFVFLAAKYAGIAARYPNGGGVVSVSQEAFGPRVGALGGMLILVDYFLTAAISAVSGITYLATVIPLHELAKVPLVVFALALLGLINWVGIRESALSSLIAAVASLVTLAIVGVLTAVQIDASDWARIGDSLTSAGQIPLSAAVTGYAAAWLSFSGLESLAQISPAMADPRRRTAALAMGFVALTVLATSPLLTAFSTTLLDPAQIDPDALQAELALAQGGPILRVFVVIAASGLLLFAANTAVVGAYHVFSALAEAQFLPHLLLRRSPRFGTPALAIFVSTAVPAVIVIATFADVAALGALYAFGLLGAFVLASTAVDRLRILEGDTGLKFVIGVATSVLVIVAWATNLIEKPAATVFGGALTLAMLAIALVQHGDIRVPRRAAPMVTAEEAERLAAERPAAMRLLTLAEALDLKGLYPVRTLVCLRGPNERVVEEAAIHARGRDEHNVAVLYIDEVPGLFVPRDTEPTRDARDVLVTAAEWFQRHEITALPIWRIAQSAGDAIADVAAELGIDAVFIGTSRRGTLWRMLRGSAITRLVAATPAQTRIVIVG